MREITVYDTAGRPLTDVVQYDRNVVVCIKDTEVDKAYPVHFFNAHTAGKALVVETTFASGTLKAKIPDILLRQDRNIAGYVYITKNDESRSILGFTVQMTPRPEPSDIIHVDDKDYINITDVLTECRDLAKQSETNKTAAETAKTKAETAANTATTQANTATAAKTAAEAAKTAAETAKTTATQQATTATQQASAAAKSATDAAASAAAAKKSAEMATGIKQMTMDLEPAKWSGSSPYTYDIPITNLTVNQLVYVHNKMALSQAEIDAFADACITGKEQIAGKIVLQAVNKPTIKLPIVIEIGGEPT